MQFHCQTPHQIDCAWALACLEKHQNTPTNVAHHLPAATLAAHAHSHTCNLQQQPPNNYSKQYAMRFGYFQSAALTH